MFKIEWFLHKFSRYYAVIKQTFNLFHNKSYWFLSLLYKLTYIDRIIIVYNDTIEYIHTHRLNKFGFNFGWTFKILILIQNLEI